MNASLKRISQITSAPEVIQFAMDGNYESAWAMNSSQSQPYESTIKNYIDSKEFNELIVEFIWNQNDDDRRYVLTMVLNEACKVNSPIDFIRGCFDIFNQRLSFFGCIESLDQQIIGKDFLLRSPIELVRLGVFNHWFSTGPIDLWKYGQPIDKEKIIAKIHARPEVKSSNLNYQGLAFIYNFNEALSGPYHVLKTPCCTKIDKQWVVDDELVWKYIEELLVEA